MTIERFFEPAAIEVQRYVEGTDELGNPVKEWRHHLTIDGRIDAETSGEEERAAAAATTSTHMLFCPVVDIQEKDRVIYKGRVFNVIFVDNPMNYGRFLQVSLEEVR